jgi:hypothetical protein
LLWGESPIAAALGFEEKRRVVALAQEQDETEVLESPE